MSFPLRKMLFRPVNLQYPGRRSSLNDVSYKHVCRISAEDYGKAQITDNQDLSAYIRGRAIHLQAVIKKRVAKHGVVRNSVLHKLP